MQKIRAARPKEQIKEQRQPYDAKYEIKRKAAAELIQKKYIELKNKEKQNIKTREEATIMANEILNNILDMVPNMKIQNGQMKKKRGPKVK